MATINKPNPLDRLQQVQNIMHLIATCARRLDDPTDCDAIGYAVHHASTLIDEAISALHSQRAILDPSKQAGEGAKRRPV